MKDTTSNYYVFMDNITGGVPAGVIAASIVFALLGLTLVTLLNVQKGIKHSPDTASKFRWQDFGVDSLIRVLISLIITLIVIFVSLRFSNEFFGTPVTMIGSFAVGFGVDKLTIIINRYASKFNKSNSETKN